MNFHSFYSLFRTDPLAPVEAPHSELGVTMLSTAQVRYETRKQQEFTFAQVSGAWTQ